MPGPIIPGEVVAKKLALYPPEVFDAFNELISVNYDRNGASEFTQEDVITKMKEKGLEHMAIFENGWLNVEAVYEASGWEVKVDVNDHSDTVTIVTYTFKRKK